MPYFMRQATFSVLLSYLLDRFAKGTIEKIYPEIYEVGAVH